MAESQLPDPGATAEFFDSVVSRLRGGMKREQFDTWFRGFGLVGIDADKVEFTVPSVFVRDWMTRNYLPAIQKAVHGACGQDLRVRISLNGISQISAKVESDRSVQALEKGIEQVLATSRPEVDRTESARAPVLTAPPGTNLNREYVFEQFVVGASNRIAHAAAFAIGENPGCSYNPLFVHGNVGLGKTHLLQAVCHSIRQRDASARVLFMSCEEFTNQYIQSIRDNRLDTFRENHRKADVLVIDDIQFLAGKDKTQEEFFHTFNALYQNQKQIVISSDRSPQEIPTIEERLVSRFKWGLVTEIEVPDFETRVAIVQRKARLRSKDQEFPEEVAYQIAERITSNIREIEGAVIKVIGMSTILGEPISLRLTDEALKGVAASRNAHITLDHIMGVITQEFSLSERDITGRKRTQAVSLPRQIGMFLSRRHTEHSLEEIGRFFGRRDHTTVLYSVNKIEGRIQSDRMLKELLEALSGRLMSGR